MVVYHVTYDANRWYQNSINNDPTKEYFQLVDAGTTQNSASSPFPGTLSKKSFTAYTTPAFKNWDGTSLYQTLLNITEANKNITVDVGEEVKREIVVSTKSRIGSIGTVLVSCAYSSVTLKGGETASFYVPNIQSDIPYSATFNGEATINGTIKQSANPTDTIKLWYNVYEVYTAQARKMISGIDVKGSNGEKYTSNNQGAFTAYLPFTTEGVTFTVSSDKYHSTSKYLNNLTSTNSKLALELVSRIEDEQFSIAPNPTTSSRFFVYSKAENATVFIYNFKGALIHSQDISTGMNQIQNRAITKGFYIAKIKTKEGAEETKKVIIL